MSSPWLVYSSLLIQIFPKNKDMYFLVLPHLTHPLLKCLEHICFIIHHTIILGQRCGLKMFEGFTVFHQQYLQVMLETMRSPEVFVWNLCSSMNILYKNHNTLIRYDKHLSLSMCSCLPFKGLACSGWLIQVISKINLTHTSYRIVL